MASRGILAACVFLSGVAVIFAASSANYINDPAVVDNGGGAASSANHSNTAAIGQPLLGVASTPSYTNLIGFFTLAVPSAPPASLPSLRNDVVALVSGGSLRPTYGTVLLQLLDSAMLRIREYRFSAAVSLLKSFNGYVTKYVAMGALSDGSALIAQSNAIIAVLGGIDAGLKGNWTFNQSSGATATDSSGNNNTGVLFGGPVWTAGKIGNGLLFNGTSARVDVQNSIPDDFSLSLWLRTTSTGAGGTEAYQGHGIAWSDVGGAANDMVPMALLGTKLSFFTGHVNPVLGSSLQSASNVNTGAWVHVAVTRVRSTGEKRIYVNGVQEASGTSSTATLNANPVLVLGANPLDGRYLSGLLDEVRIYNRALTPAEISVLAGLP